MTIEANARGSADIRIRQVDAPSEMRAVEELQKEVWGVPDLDVVPLTQFVAAVKAGGVLLGAFDENAMVGFAYGFVGFEHGQTTHHSHMLAVKTAYRNLNVGYRLKLAQRDFVLAQGISEMTWTFDPLQSLNGYFNFNRLGVTSDSYLVNFYGMDAESFLHRNGTDRLWVTWLLDSHRVEEWLLGARPIYDLNKAKPLVEVAEKYVPRSNDSAIEAAVDMASIEIPANISMLEKQNSELAQEWRICTRQAFTEAFEAGFVVEDFHRETRGEISLGKYLLSRKKEQTHKKK